MDNVIKDLVSALKKSCPLKSDEYFKTMGWNMAVLAVADSFAKTIPEFNRAKFLKDCGYI